MTDVNQKTDSYRDSVSTVDKEGKRIWLYPKKPKGPLYKARNLVSLFLLAILFAGPFIKINGQPALLLNVLERKFYVFGLTFWPQDFYLFVLASVALVVFIILFTVVFGRIWCGWACPQTIFMEMVFRKIEYWIEGDARRQRELNASPMNAEKFLKRSTKHVIFFALSFLIGNTFLAYIIGADALIKIITDSPSAHIAGLSAMLIFSGIFYWVYASFREQVCTMVCPYGRLQGVLLDKNSIVVAYDFKRGEPRENFSRKRDRSGSGDCIDCAQCVDVCPTGIDIRNGTQLECVNCTACIDACNSVMKKVNLPKGLIRYDSYQGIVDGTKLKFSPRILGYSSVLIVLIAALAVAMINRSDIETTILRTPGVLYQELEDGKISNLYNIKVINKSLEPAAIRIKSLNPFANIRMVGGELTVPGNDYLETSFFIEIPGEKVVLANMPVAIDIYSGENLVQSLRTSFNGPEKLRNRHD
ncbi:MAG: cytochrome c oxidase accessory protein CcoG [Calditrichaceae bacterium]